MRHIGYHHFTVLYPGIDEILERDHRLRVCLVRNAHYPDRWDIFDIILPNQRFGENSGVGPGDRWVGSYHEEHRAMVVVSEKHPAHSVFEFLTGAVMMGSLDEHRARQMLGDVLDVGREIGEKILSDAMVLGVGARDEAGRSTQ